MNILWLIMVCVSIVFAIFTGNLEAYTKSIFDGAKAAVEISLYLLGIAVVYVAGLTPRRTRAALAAAVAAVLGVGVFLLALEVFRGESGGRAFSRAFRSTAYSFCSASRIGRTLRPFVCCASTKRLRACAQHATSITPSRRSTGL